MAEESNKFPTNSTIVEKNYEALTEEDCLRLFVVDEHLANVDSSLLYRNPQKVKGLISVSHIFEKPYQGKYMRHTYSVDGWHVSVVWPAKWPSPAPNRLGWLPKCEFGQGKDSYFNNPKDVSLIAEAHFRYTTMDGKEYP